MQLHWATSFEHSPFNSFLNSVSEGQEKHPSSHFQAFRAISNVQSSSEEIEKEH